MAIATWKVVRRPHSSSQALLGQEPVNRLGEITAVLFISQGQMFLGGLCTVTLGAQPVSLGGPGMPLGCISFGHPVIVEIPWDLWP